MFLTAGSRIQVELCQISGIRRRDWMLEGVQREEGAVGTRIKANIRGVEYTEPGWAVAAERQSSTQMSEASEHQRGSGILNAKKGAFLGVMAEASHSTSGKSESPQLWNAGEWAHPESSEAPQERGHQRNFALLFSDRLNPLDVICCSVVEKK